MTHTQRGSWVPGDENLLDGNQLRAMPLQHAEKFKVDASQTDGQVSGTRVNNPPFEGGYATALPGDDAPAGGGESGIYTEDDQSAAISSSGMSKFDQTFCTSSCSSRISINLITDRACSLETGT